MLAHLPANSGQRIPKHMPKPETDGIFVSACAFLYLYNKPHCLAHGVFSLVVTLTVKDFRTTPYNPGGYTVRSPLK